MIIILRLGEACRNCVYRSYIEPLGPLSEKILHQRTIQVGAADYIALAQQYHTVFITDIPIMSMRMIDKVCSFISLKLLD